MESCPSLSEAVASFLAGLPAEGREKAQQEVYRFARWCGWDRPLDEFKAPEVGRYSEQICSQSVDPVKALEPARAFLAYLKKSGFTKTNLSVHLRARKSAMSKAQADKPVSDANQMTAKGHADLVAELKSLEEKRPQVVAEITRAAADKDFRENAPLQAAKETQSYLEGRIQEIEATLKTATVVSGKTSEKAGIGDTLLITEVDSGDELRITLVHATEADPNKGKISLASPMGKACVGRQSGDSINVAAPAGVLRYKVIDIKRIR